MDREGLGLGDNVYGAGEAGSETGTDDGDWVGIEDGRMNDVGTGMVLGMGLDAGLAIRFWWEMGMSLEVELCFFILFISPLPPPHTMSLSTSCLSFPFHL